MFGDITTGRIWYADHRGRARGRRCQSRRRWRRFTRWTRVFARIVEDAYRARGGKGETLPGAARVSGRGRVDMRFAIDDAGELYLLTKPDGMIRKIVGASVTTAPAMTSAAPHEQPAAAAAARRASSSGYARRRSA